LFADERFAPPSEPVGADALFTLSPAMRDYLHSAAFTSRFQDRNWRFHDSCQDTLGNFWRLEDPTVTNDSINGDVFGFQNLHPDLHRTKGTKQM